MNILLTTQRFIKKSISLPISIPISLPISIKISNINIYKCKNNVNNNIHIRSFNTFNTLNNNNNPNPNVNQQTGLSVLRVNSSGQVDSLYITVDKFLREKTMHARDLLALGITHSNSNVAYGSGLYNQHNQHHDIEETYNTYKPTSPLLLPRANSLIVSFGNIRTIIYRDHVLILDPNTTVKSQHSDNVRIFADTLSQSILNKEKTQGQIQQCRELDAGTATGRGSHTNPNPNTLNHNTNTNPPLNNFQDPADPVVGL